MSAMTAADGTTGDREQAAAYATFRPFRSRVVSLGVGVAVVAAFTVIALQIPHGGVTGWGAADSAALVAFGVAIAAFLLRYALVRATPSPSGLHVQNLIASRDVEWAEIVNVQFGNGAPWLTLELDDTETLAVMAVQHSDGARADREARRLAALVQANNRPESDD